MPGISLLAASSEKNVFMKLAPAIIYENIKLALESVRAHMLRAMLTVLIIAFGIMALVGILTAIDSIKLSITDNFARLGASSFSIRNREMMVQPGGGTPQVFERISYDEAVAFKEQFDFPAYVSISVHGTGSATARYLNQETNPNIRVVGSDDNYLVTSGAELASGRNFSQSELQYGANVVLLGHDVASTLFGDGTGPLGKIVTIANMRYEVIGVLEQRGAGLGFSDDLNSIIPYMTLRQNFSRPNMNYTINVSAFDMGALDEAISEATGLFRIIRGVRVGEPNSFDIAKSDNIAQALIENISFVTIAATVIGLITLLGAAIGLMNIMLVSVTELTQEVGIRKALGASRSVIRQQFLSEAIVICQLGGLLGIVLGIIAGNGISLLVGSNFIIPWLWVLSGILLCFGVGVLAGYYPAAKASALDPIESLRYE